MVFRVPESSENWQLVSFKKGSNLYLNYWLLVDALPHATYKEMVDLLAKYHSVKAYISRSSAFSSLWSRR